MKDKKCSGCGKEIFNTKSNKSGLCKKCWSKEYNQRPEIKQRGKEYREKNKDRFKKYREVNKEKIYKQRREYLSKPEVKKRIIEQTKEYRNRSEIKEGKRRWLKEYNQKPEIKKRMKEYQKSPEAKQKMKEYLKIRRREDKNFRITTNIRTRFAIALKDYTREGKIMSSNKYGIKFKKIIEHLKPFPAEITKYHIDHIKPLASFNFINEDGTQNLEEIKKAFAPENHQWLLAEDNFKKGCKVIGQSKLF